MKPKQANLLILSDTSSIEEEKYKEHVLNMLHQQQQKSESCEML